MQVRALLEGLEHVATRAEVAKLGLDAARLTDPLAWYTLEELDQLTIQAVRLSRDDAFGLHWGERAPMVQFDQLPILVATAPSLRTVIACLLRFQPALATANEFRFEERRGRGVLHCDALALDQRARRTRSEAVLVALRRLLLYFGEGASLRRVNFPHARPEYGAEYDALFGVPVYFGQAGASIEFASAALERPPRQRDTELHQTLLLRFEQLRKRALGALSYTDQLEELIRVALPDAPRQQDAARALKLSERSLRRRLQEERVTYSELVERVRRRTAEQLLARGDKSAKELAGALGYTSDSGFHRAARRWKLGVRRAETSGSIP